MIHTIHNSFQSWHCWQQTVRSIWTWPYHLQTGLCPEWSHCIQALASNQEKLCYCDPLGDNSNNDGISTPSSVQSCFLSFLQASIPNAKPCSQQALVLPLFPSQYNAPIHKWLPLVSATEATLVEVVSSAFISRMIFQVDLLQQVRTPSDTKTYYILDNDSLLPSPQNDSPRSTDWQIWKHRAIRLRDLPLVVIWREKMCLQNNLLPLGLKSL